MARLICTAIQLILFTGLLCEQSIAKGADYTVKVTLSPANEPLSIELVSLQCTITPTPSSPVVYLWRSSTQNHNFETSLSSSMPRTFVTVNVNQPLFGRYFCHVLLASNYTTLAVGHITIFLSGILRPIEPINKVFTPPAPLQMEVDILPEFSQKRLLNSLRNITYEWQHNDTILSNQVLNNALVIAPTSDTDAGIYKVKIASFGFSNHATNEVCAVIVLEYLRSYAIFQGVEFYAYNSNASGSTNLKELGVEPSKSPHTIKEVLFISGEPLTVDTIIQPELYHIGLILVFPVPLRLKLFYNGQQLLPINSSGGIKHPSEVSSSFIRPTEGLGVPVNFKLPSPTPEDEGLYEMQLFIDFDGLLLNLPNCSDYSRFLQTPDGLELHEILIGSLTLMVHEQGQQGQPQIIIEATEQVISANSIEAPPVLTCSVMKDRELFPANQIRWKKGRKVLARTKVSGMLVLDTAPNPTLFGVYTCEAIINQSIAESSILIAERAHFKMELLPISSIKCLDLSEETNELMLDMLLMELQFSFSYETEDDFTRENTAHSSLTCSTEGSSILMSTDIIYSNSDGSITATALVETAGEWMNGIRTANEVTFQIARPGPVTSDRSQQALESRDIAVIILSILVAGVLVLDLVILVICVQRKHSKKKNIGQQNLLPLVRESVINNSEITTSEAPTQILPTSISYDRLVEVQHSVPLLVYRESKPLDSSRVLPKVYTIRGGTHLANVQEASADVQVMHSLLSLRPNYAYNRRHDLPGLDSHQDSTNQQSQTTTHDGRLLFNQRQISVHHYDYPKVQEHLCAGDTDSLGYQSIM